MHVVDGEIKYVETDNTGDDDYDGARQVRACLRVVVPMRRRVYNPDRPRWSDEARSMRGEGNGCISWTKPTHIIATNMQRLIKEYGNESIYLNYGTERWAAL